MRASILSVAVAFAFTGKTEEMINRFPLISISRSRVQVSSSSV